MIFLTKLNGEQFVLNCEQIQMIEVIPESKVVLMNREFFIVKENLHQIIEKTVEYQALIIKRAQTGDLQVQTGENQEGR